MDGFFQRLTWSNERACRLGRHFIFWLSWWLFFGFLYGFPAAAALHTVPAPLAFLEALIYLPQHIFLSYGLLYFVLPRLLLNGRWWTGLASVIVLILLASMMSQLVATYAIVPLRDALHVEYKPTTKFYASLLSGLRGSMTVAGFAVAIKLIKLWYVKKIDNERLEKVTLRSELELLKGQLHPHFMFNTLNTIYSFSLTGSEKTSQSILELSHLMRYMLIDCAQPLVDIEKEIQTVCDYIQLEKARLGSRFEMSVNFSGDFDGIKIPPLLLMPFVENSFKHGASAMIEHTWMTLDLCVTNDVLKFKLINGKSRAQHKSTLSSGVGLANVRRRLGLLYPAAHELRIIENDDTYVVLLTLQLKKIIVPTAYESV